MESINNNAQYAGQESKRRLCREVNIAIFTELIRASAAVEDIEEHEQSTRSNESDKMARRLDVRYVFMSMLDSRESVETL